jgi:nitroreductase
MCQPDFLPLIDYTCIPPEESVLRSENFNTLLQKRRSVRTFSCRSFPADIVKNCIRAAGSSPSGANKQPWHFVAVSDPALKKRIRNSAEAEEREFYSGRASDKWLKDLKPLGTDFTKPFLETAPYLIIIFERKYEESESGKINFYYTKESVGIAAGILITAIHNAGLASLTYTPARINFLNSILERPKSDRPFMILALGYPAEDTVVPHINRKSLEEIATFI